MLLSSAAPFILHQTSKICKNNCFSLTRFNIIFTDKPLSLSGRGFYFYNLKQGVIFLPVKIIATRERVTAFLDGEIDHHSAGEIRMEIDTAIQNCKPKLLKLDYGDVTFMDSSGVGLVMGRYRNMLPFGGKVIVTNLSPRLYKVMQLSGLEKIVKISKREEVSNADNK